MKIFPPIWKVSQEYSFHYFLKIVLLMFIFHYQRFNIFTQIIMRWSFIQRMEHMLSGFLYILSQIIWMIQDFFSATVESCWIWTILRRWNPITSKWQIQSVFQSKRKDASKSESNISNTSFWNLRRHDLLWLFMIFLHIYVHLQSSFHWQFFACFQ